MAQIQAAGSVEALPQLSRGGPSQAWYRPLLRFMRTKPLGTFSGFIILLLVVLAVAAPIVSPFNPDVHDNAHELKRPSALHAFGTDQYGRDIASRIVYGARTSLYVGVGATLLSIVLAVVIGTASAYFGGTLDYCVQRVVDSVQAIPSIVLLIAILVILGPSLTNVIIALSARAAMVTSRVIRGSALSVLAQPYLDAGRLLGASHTRLIARYIVPNIMAPVIVLASINFGANILAEASLSFLGYGVPPPTATWGGMLSAEGRAYMFVAPWLLVAPTVALTVVVFASNMLGDALRDVLDPRLRGGGSAGRAGALA